MQISNVCLLAMRKGIVSTIVLREELNSFFPIILHDECKCHEFVDIIVSKNPSEKHFSLTDGRTIVCIQIPEADCLPPYIDNSMS